MRIVIDGDAFCWQEQGGISRIFRNVIPRLVQLNSGLCVNIVLPREPVVPLDFADSERVRVMALPCLPRSLKPWKFWHKVSPFVNKKLQNVFWRKQAVDVFLSTYYNSPSCSGAKVCVVYDMIFEKLPKLFSDRGAEEMRIRKSRAITDADLVICISESAKRDVLEQFPAFESKCNVVRLAGFDGGAISLDSLHAPAVVTTPFILYVGNYKSPHKNFLFLLDCLAKLEDGFMRDCSLVVVSPWEPTTSEMDVFGDRWPGGKLRFMNQCDDEQLKALYSQCMAFVYPSLYEGFGIPVLEALACGTPVVCSNSSSLPEVGGNAVYYFDPRLHSQFNEAIRHAVSDGRDSGKVISRKNQAETFSWDKTAEGFMNAINQVANKPVKL